MLFKLINLTLGKKQHAMKQRNKHAMFSSGKYWRWSLIYVRRSFRMRVSNGKIHNPSHAMSPWQWEFWSFRKFGEKKRMIAHKEIILINKKYMYMKLFSHKKYICISNRYGVRIPPAACPKY